MRRFYWVCFILAPVTAFAIAFLAGPSTRPVGNGRVIETDFGPLLWVPLKWMFVGSWLSIWVLGAWAGMSKRSMPGVVARLNRLPELVSHLALAAMGTLVLTPVGYFTGLYFNSRSWLRIAVAPRIEMTDDLGTSWVVEGEGLQDPMWEVRRIVHSGLWTVRAEMLGRVSVDEYEHGVPVLRPEPGRVLETHQIYRGRMELLRGGGVAMFTSTGDCSFAYDPKCDKAWGVNPNGPAGDGFPPFYALLGVTDIPSEVDISALLERVRVAVAGGRGSMEEGMEQLGTVPSDEVVAAALGHANPRVREVAREIARVGGVTFYPKSTQLAAEKESLPRGPRAGPR